MDFLFWLLLAVPTLPVDQKVYREPPPAPYCAVVTSQAK